MANKAEWSFVMMAEQFVGHPDNSESTNRYFDPRVIALDGGAEGVMFRIVRGNHYPAQAMVKKGRLVRVRIEVEDVNDEAVNEANAIDSKESAIAFLNRFFPNWREQAT